MHFFPVVELGGLNFDLSSILAILVSCIVVFALARAAVSNLSVHNPSKIQNFLEWVAEFVHNTIASTMPLSKAKTYVSLGMTLIMFIFVSNLLGLPFGVVTELDDAHKGPVTVLGMQIMSGEEVERLHEEGKHISFAWWKSPTADLSVTAGLAIIVFILVHFLGLTRNTKHYLKHYFEPFPVFFPLNVMKEAAKPLTLALRLYANIFAGEVLISTILMMGWIGLPLMAVWQGFSVFVGAIQAFLFTILTMVYISQATIHEHDEEHH
ncbi:ATP synthase F0 subunit A [Paenibacillus darwinianus]|uniref:ATP synthase subunit a n=1 Tax=Paenibacillus darwinianus TaxID=1380763 RepID=A0A9W5S0I4_9BACL|nr:F0F1 ATP synthase subunit A [Paenibacillus darwinianus]EXX87377.1 ATP synthase F0 subunit A [Paenibacillus darwinianus]EXX87424.1 ATP synthase F0 subunit A [Paenibacillus darwinianus]EXX88833.1 ATP synthase F0 subunit A [Paenibacillus darwinianus]